eukprot:GHVS01093966.1.p1 GENE.GHVS01093966.1~~GHVS01093966.1.p1  ORF type:complete len:542 (+),score=66.84 GHVS01093966.1:612-2237(+)
MDSLTLTCWILVAAILSLFFLSYAIYAHFISPTSYFSPPHCLSSLVIVTTLSASFLSVVIIPLAIFLVAKPDISAASLHLTQPALQTAYFGLLAFLLFLSFVAIPFAYFHVQVDSVDDDVAVDNSSVDKCCSSLRQTVAFVAVVVSLLVCGLVFKSGSTISPSLKELSWVKQLLDADHSGYAAMTFTIACLTALGCYAWMTYTAVGLASLPLLWLRSPPSSLQLRKEVETDIAELRYRQRALQAKCGGGGISTEDKSELMRLERQQIALGHRNYKLQEQASLSSFVGALLKLLVPFRLAAGCVMLSLSLLLFVSLLLSNVDRLLHSSCGWRCGFVIAQPAVRLDRFWTPLDAALLSLSEYFPLDFVVFSTLVLYVFASSIYALLRLGIRWLCIIAPTTSYVIKPHKTKPQALLFLCFLITHILLAFTMTLVALAPHYASYGTQTYTPENGSSAISCYPPPPFESSCRLSVIASFFSRIAIGLPIASLFYFSANWVFIVVFGYTVIRHALCLDKPKSILQQLDDDESVDEEATGLLQMNKTV